jgi:hypothetical protein
MGCSIVAPIPHPAQLHVTWDAVYQIIGYMVLLGLFLGPSCLAGLATMLFFIPVQVRGGGVGGGSNHGWLGSRLR